jgi:hypothetical protein
MADKPLSFTLEDSRRLGSVQADRLGRYDRICTVKMNTGQVLVISIPDELFNEAALVAAVRKEIGTEGGLRGKTFPL